MAALLPNLERTQDEGEELRLVLSESPPATLVVERFPESVRAQLAAGGFELVEFAVLSSVEGRRGFETHKLLEPGRRTLAELEAASTPLPSLGPGTHVLRAVLQVRLGAGGASEWRSQAIVRHVPPIVEPEMLERRAWHAANLLRRVGHQVESFNARGGGPADDPGRRATDGRFDTSWSFDVEPRDPWLRLRFPVPTTAARLVLWPRGQLLRKRDPPPRAVCVVVNGGVGPWLEFPADPTQPLVIELGGAKVLKTLELRFARDADYKLKRKSFGLDEVLLLQD